LDLITNRPLAFELVTTQGTLETLGDAVTMIGQLTPEQRDTYWWNSALQALNTAIREPAYTNAATLTLQTALNLNGMLVQPPEIP
jgi:hypothetical protein